MLRFLVLEISSTNKELRLHRHCHYGIEFEEKYLPSMTYIWLCIFVWFLVWKFCVYLSLCPFAFTLKWLSDGVGRTVEIKYFEQFARRVLFYFMIKIQKISKRLRETRIFQRNLWIYKTLFTGLCIILSCECINAFHRRRLGELKVWPQVLMMSSGNTRAMNHLSLIFLSFDLHAL